jgi:CDP-glycerol glycerophosphotransferase
MALAFDATRSEWFYRLGFVSERMGDFLAAAAAYENAVLTSNVRRPYWSYRWGYVLDRAGLYERACLAFAGLRYGHNLSVLVGGSSGARALLTELSRSCESMSGLDQTDAAAQFERAQAALLAGHLDKGAGHLKMAIDRLSVHNEKLFQLLGQIYSLLGRYEEASTWYRGSRIIQRAPGMDTKPAEKDRGISRVANYIEFSESLPIREEVILYDANLGKSIGCNPLALFNSIVDDPRYSHMLHVWALNDPNSAPSEMKVRENVAVVVRESDGYLRHLATAKFLINNSTFPSYFIRRAEQKYLNTWHGTPLKAMGIDMKIPSEFMSHANTARNFLHATHMISPNQHTSDVLIKRYDLAGLFSGKLAETGYPRSDRMLNATDMDRARTKERLGISPNKKVVLYLPTWRGSMNDVNSDIRKLQDDLRTLRVPGSEVIFRGHHYAEESLQSTDAATWVAPKEIDTYDLLAVADVLVTDYSSVFFDFLVTDKPIIFYAYDLEDYVSERGSLYFDLAEFPGTVCRTPDALSQAVKRAMSAVDGKDERRPRAKSRFAPFDDGQASRRVLDFFMEDDDEHVVDRYPVSDMNLLFYGSGFLPNGITTSFINLMRDLETDGSFNIAVALTPSDVSSSEARLEKFNLLPEGARKLARVGRFASSYEDRWVRKQVESDRESPSDELFEAYVLSSRREFVRLFGRTPWVARVVFDGYGTMWPSTFAAAPATAGKSLIYLHNDMLEEKRSKYPSLSTLFHLYDRFDALVSVSDTMATTNRGKLTSVYPISPSKFLSCPNTIDAEGIQSMAAIPLDEDLASFCQDKTIFLNIARLSPEKDQSKLLKAFTSACGARDDVGLVVLGDGPLRDRLKEEVRALNISSKVFFGGLRANPFPMLKHCDCFVLSSNHEGQPMTLLESLALKKPIVATDIDGNRGVLGKDLGFLVPNSVEGLADGLQKFLDGGVTAAEFDATAYQRSAVEAFKGLLAACQPSNQGGMI